LYTFSFFSVFIYRIIRPPHTSLFLHLSFPFLVLCYAHLSPLLPKVFSVTSFLLHALAAFSVTRNSVHIAVSYLGRAPVSKIRYSRKLGHVYRGSLNAWARTESTGSSCCTGQRFCSLRFSCKIIVCYKQSHFHCTASNSCERLYVGYCQALINWYGCRLISMNRCYTISQKNIRY
jgi:hypothetical protein